MPHPAGPKPRLLTGHLAPFRADRLGFFTHCARTYGDVVPLRLLRYRVLLISRPDLIEEVLVTRAKRFVKHFGLRMYKPILGNGLVTAEGDFWRRQRKLSAPAFQAARLDGYARTMVASAQRTVEAWAAAGPRGTPRHRDISGDMTRLTLEIACKTLFGADSCPDPAVVGHAIEGGLAGIAARFARPIPLPGWVPTPANLRLRRSLRSLADVINGIVASRRAAGGGDDLLSTLIAARDDDGSGMSDRQLLDEALTLFLAGHETTALTLTYALYLLANHSQAQDALREEVTTVLGDRTPTLADLPRLVYARQVVNESLRLYPPADFLGREAVEDCTVGGVPVRRGTNLFMSQWVMHRDPRHFAEPERFEPERWTDAFERSLPRFAYFPFGGGPRFCIGQTFAMAEAILVLATLCQRWSFTPDLDYQLALYPGITLRPAKNVRLFVSDNQS